MHVVVASKLLGERDGGSQRSIGELVERLLAAGHHVTAVATTLPEGAPFPTVPVDSPDELARALVEARPDVVLTQLHWSTAAVGAARRLGVPSVFFSRLGECQVGAELIVFNSEYCARRHPGVRDRSLVVTPVVDAAIREGRERDGRDAVVMVNPIRLKGGERLARIAPATPELEFLAVGGWWDPSLDGIELGGIPNLTHVPPVADMDALWARAIALLVPSVWPEPAGRVIIEAHAAGVPVIASTAGGMREMHGEAGVVVNDADDPGAWASAIRAIAHDPSRWTELSRAGTDQARSYRAITTARVHALMERLERLPSERPPTQEPRLDVPDELKAFEYLTRHVFDPARPDFLP